MDNFDESYIYFYNPGCGACIALNEIIEEHNDDKDTQTNLFVFDLDNEEESTRKAKKLLETRKGKKNIFIVKQRSENPPSGAWPNVFKLSGDWSNGKVFYYKNKGLVGQNEIMPLWS